MNSRRGPLVTEESKEEHSVYFIMKVIVHLTDSRLA